MVCISGRSEPRCGKWASERELGNGVWWLGMSLHSNWWSFLEKGRIFCLGDQQICKIPNGSFIVGLVYKRRKETFRPLAFKRKALVRSEPNRIWLKPSKHRAERTKPELFAFNNKLFFSFIVFGGRGESKLDWGSGCLLIFFLCFSLFFFEHFTLRPDFFRSLD